jgi:hypothetical protein
MKKEIKTSCGIYTYEPVKLYDGNKPLDRKNRQLDRNVSRLNLLDFRQLLNHNQIPFGIIFGTLLGAVRDGDFISHDDDTDVFILNENREKFLALLFDFRKIGFEVAIYDKSLSSIIRNNEFIDIYFFRKNILGNRVCNGDSLSPKYLGAFDCIDFLGVPFNTPNNYISFLEKAYGKDWRISKKDAPAKVKGLLNKIVVLAKRILPSKVIKLLQQINNHTLKIE